MPLLACPFSNVKKHTAYPGLVQLNDYQIQVMKKAHAKSLLLTHLILVNSPSVDHQVQVLKKKNTKGLLITSFYVAMLLFLGEFAPILWPFFLNMERFITTFNISCNQAVKQNKKM